MNLPILDIRRDDGEDALLQHQLTDDERRISSEMCEAVPDDDSENLQATFLAVAAVGKRHGLTRNQSVSLWTRATFRLFDRRPAAPRPPKVNDPAVRLHLLRQWAHRAYRVFAVLGAPAAPSLWHWQAWQSLVPFLDPVFSAARDRPSLRTWQQDAGTHADLRFGRLAWNEAGHKKWTHGSPVTQDRSPNWRFQDVEVWAPSWNRSVDESLPPDIYLNIMSQESWLGLGEVLAYNPVVVFAVAADLPTPTHDAARRAVVRISELTTAVLTAETLRPWAEVFGGAGCQHSLNDLLPHELFASTTHHGAPVNLATLSDGWHLFPRPV